MPCNAPSHRNLESCFKYLSDDTSIWTCTRGVWCKQAVISYKKFILHVQTSFLDYEILFSMEKNVNNFWIDCSFSTKKLLAFLQRYELVISCLMPFSAIDNGTVKINTKLYSILPPIFLRSISSLMQVVESKMYKLMPDCIALVFDSWSLARRTTRTILFSLNHTEQRDIRFVSSCLQHL